MSNQIKTNYGALSTLVTVFFFWGFIAAGNGVFIPFCKSYFHLDQFQSQLVDYAFYVAYYIGALILFLVGVTISNDIVGKWGYKKSIIYGLLFSAFGSIVMIIAVNASEFYGMLLGLFIVALGFSLQQTAAQPFSIVLGDPATASGRVNLGGGVNSFGTMIGPIIVSLLLFGKASATDNDKNALDISTVSYLYMGVAALFVVAALIFGLSKKVPAGINVEKVEPASKAMYTLVIMTILLVVTFVPVFNSYNSIENITELEKHNLEFYRMKWLFGALIVVLVGLIFSYFSAQKNQKGWGAMKYPQLVLGMLAIFCYVGVEVTIQSNLGELLKQDFMGGFTDAQISPYISMYWGSLMVGRWAGSVSAFNLAQGKKQLLMILLPIIAFGLILFANSMAGSDMNPFYGYIVMVIIQIIAAYFTKDKPSETLLLFSLLGVLAVLYGIFNTGEYAIYALLSGGLWCSIMWPNIFSLSVAGLGKYTTQGSAFLIMMILGGGIIPPLQGKLADYLQSGSEVPGYGIQNSYWVAVFCFLYLAVFAFIVKNILKKQGISYDAKSSAGH